MNILFRKPLLAGKRFAFRVFPLLIFTLIAFQSCVMENMSDCKEYHMVVKIVDVSSESGTPSTLDTVGVYLFSKDGFERMISTGKKSGFLFNYVSNTQLNFGFDKNSPLTLVAWGNLNRNSLTLPSLNKGQSPEGSMIQLRRCEEYDKITTDLFYSSCTTNDQKAANGDTLILYMNRVLGAMKVTCKSVGECFGPGTDPFRLEARSTTNALNFLANATGKASTFCPGLEKCVNGEYVTPVFNLLPTAADDPMTLELYRGDSLVYTGNIDNEGNLLRAKANEQLNVTIDFGAAGNQAVVTVTATPWGNSNQEVGL